MSLRTGTRPARAAALTRGLATLRAHGPYVLVDRVAPRLGVRRLLVLERRADSAAASDVHDLAGVTLHAWSGDDAALQALAELDAAAGANQAARATRLVRYQEQLARGDRPFVAERDGRPCALCWTAAGATPIAYLGCELRLRSDERYLYDAITRHDARGARLMPALYAHALGALARDGVARTVTLVRPSNAPMLRAMAHAGFSVCGSLARLTIAGRALYLGKPGVAFVPVRQRRGA
jgi:hypothetical protein